MSVDSSAINIVLKYHSNSGLLASVVTVTIKVSSSSIVFTSDTFIELSNNSLTKSIEPEAEHSPKST